VEFYGFDAGYLERLASGDPATEKHFHSYFGELILIKRRRSLDNEELPFGYEWLIAQVLREKRLFRDIAIASIICTFFAFSIHAFCNHHFLTLGLACVALAFVGVEREGSRLAEAPSGKKAS